MSMWPDAFATSLLRRSCYVIIIRNPSREQPTYVASYGFASNPREARVFNSFEVAHIKMQQLREFLHLDDNVSAVMGFQG